jgi:DNA mismatch repair ATPase MutS
MDELLHGTNSHDRLLGAKSLISHMLKHGGIGVITTHDLSLTKVIDELNLSAQNMHFQDQFEKNKFSFGYKVHEGVVQKSNALELMRSIGIEV